MKKFIEIYWNSFMGGVCLSFGIAAYLVVLTLTNNNAIAACIFPIGLFLCYNLGGNLFTTDIIKLHDAKKEQTYSIKYYWTRLAATLIMNLLSVNMMGLIFGLLINPQTQIFVNASWTSKLVGFKDYHFINLCVVIFIILLKGILCNFLICSTYTLHKTHPILGIFIPVYLFVILGLEHSITDMFYFAFNKTHINTLYYIIFIITVVIGNYIGGILYCFFKDKTLAANKI